MRPRMMVTCAVSINKTFWVHAYDWGALCALNLNPQHQNFFRKLFIIHRSHLVIVLEFTAILPETLSLTGRASFITCHTTAREH